MNIALGTLVIFLLIIPGIIFKRSYFHGVFSRDYTKNNPFDDFAWAIIPGIVFQIFAVLIVNNFFCASYHINFESLSYLLVGDKDGEKTANSFADLSNNLGKIIWYNFILWGAAWSFGYGSRKLVRKCKLDRKSRLLRFNNKWHYILSGEVLDFKENSFDPKGTVDFVYIDILTKANSSLIIYTGIIKEYFLGNDGGLNAI